MIRKTGRAYRSYSSNGIDSNMGNYFSHPKIWCKLTSMDLRSNKEILIRKLYKTIDLSVFYEIVFWLTSISRIFIEISGFIQKKFQCHHAHFCDKNAQVDFFSCRFTRASPLFFSYYFPHSVYFFPNILYSESLKVATIALKFSYI